MLVMFRGYFKLDLWKMFVELSYFYRQICAKEVSKVMMQRLEKEITVLICNMETVFPPVWFNAMQNLLLHLPWEARVGGPMQFRWMYSQEKELKKLRYTVCNKARVEGCVAEAFACKDITNFTSMYFSCANNVIAPTMRYHVVRDVLLSELTIFNGRVQVLGLQVHIMSPIRSGTIPCFICKQTWRKLNHILRSLTKHIRHLVYNPH
jgi:hypothetical protein